MKCEVLPSRTFGASKTDYSTFVNPTLKIQVFGVLVLAAIELIFFLVAGKVLCLGCSTRRMLITH